MSGIIHATFFAAYVFSSKSCCFPSVPYSHIFLLLPVWGFVVVVVGVYACGFGKRISAILQENSPAFIGVFISIHTILLLLIFFKITPRK